MGAESRRLYIQPHSGVCFEGLLSSMGSGLIVLSVWGGVGWREQCGVCICVAPMTALFMSTLAGHL